MSRRDRLRWWLWRRLIRLPGVCPANAHTRLICRGDRWQHIRVDSVCRTDLARNGTCWCGKLSTDRDRSQEIAPAKAVNDAH